MAVVLIKSAGSYRNTMKLATAAEMRELDRISIEEFGIPGALLMENAGRGVVSSIIHNWGPVTGKKYVIFCGKGNNGGDGLVIARHLSNLGARVAVRLLSENMKGDAGLNLTIARNMGLDVSLISETLERESSEARHADAVVDAIFGTGLSSEVGEPFHGVINLINACGARVVSVDIPSGVNSDNGHIMGAAVHANLTVSFGLPKRGLYLYPGAQCSGIIKIAEIGIPKSVIDSAPIEAALISRSSVVDMLPNRESESHKGSFGHLFIIAGSVGKTGAAVMAAQSASRSGAGLVTVGVPESLNDIFEEKLTEEMTVPLPEGKGRTVSYRAVDRILESLDGKTAVAIGPGLGVDGETVRLIYDLLPQIRIPILIDADALNIIAMDDEPLGNMHAPVVLTPHPGEMGRLLGIPARDVQADRPAAALKLANQYGVYVVLKGARTIVASPDGSFLLNHTGNAGMATGGTGDVLTGVIGSLMAQGLSVIDAAKAGVYIHGAAGDIVADEKGQTGLVAGDLITALPASFRALRA